MLLRLTMIASLLLCGACSDDNPPLPVDLSVDTKDAAQHDTVSHDLGADGDMGTDGELDTGADLGDLGPDLPPRPPLSPGQTWVRDNPMFISALSVKMGAPAANAVVDYYDTFGATATHLWQTGMGPTVAGWQNAKHPDFRYVSWTLADGTSQDNGKLLGGIPAGQATRIGYQVSDEPKDIADLKTLETGINAIRRADPKALIIVNFMANYDLLDGLVDYYCNLMDGDVLSYDAYEYGDDGYKALEYFRKKGIACKMPYWRYIRSFQFQKKKQLDFDVSDLRWDAFAGLLYGYTGHSWFIYTIDTANSELDPIFFKARGDYAAEKSDLFANAAQINRQLKVLGKAVTQLTSTDVRYISNLGALKPEATTAWAAGAGDDPYITAIGTAPNGSLAILAGFFKDDAGEIYVMLQNQNHKNGSWPRDSDDSGTVRVNFDFGNATGVNRTEVLTLNKESGKVESLPLYADGPNKAYLDVQLAAGDVVFFKYSTGRSFTLQQ